MCFYTGFQAAKNDWKVNTSKTYLQTAKVFLCTFLKSIACSHHLKKVFLYYWFDYKYGICRLLQNQLNIFPGLACVQDRKFFIECKGCQPSKGWQP
jgi:hypothetical protein